MITFQPVSPTVFVYKTSPSYWQMQQEEPVQQQDSSISNVNFTTTSNKALRNFSETDDSSCLCWTMQVSSQAHDLTVQALPVDDHASTWRLRIACLYKGQTVAMDRQIREPKSRIQQMTAHLSVAGTLTVVIPKLTPTSQQQWQSRNIAPVPMNTPTISTGTRNVIPIPVRSYLSQSQSTPSPHSKPGIKRLELEVPFTLAASDIQVLFHSKKQKLYISCTKTNRSFRQKFNLNSRQIQVEHMKAALYRHNSKSSLLVITAPTGTSTRHYSHGQTDNASLSSYSSSASASSSDWDGPPNRRPISIPIQHHDMESSLLQPSLHHPSYSPHNNCRQQISSQALASTHQSSKASSSAFQLELEYTILKNQIFESTQTMQQNIINDMHTSMGMRMGLPTMSPNQVNDITMEAALAVDYCASAAADAQRQVLHKMMMTTTSMASPTHLLRRLV